MKKPSRISGASWIIYINFMALSKKLRQLLEKNKIKFEPLNHRTVYTAYDLAQTLSEKLDRVVKTILIKADRAYYLIALPASKRLDLKKLAKVLKVKAVEMAPEKIMKKLYQVEPGAMTPFSVMYKLPMLIDKSLLTAKDVVGRAGSFKDSVRLKISDLIRVSEAKTASFTESIKKTVKKPLRKK